MRFRILVSVQLKIDASPKDGNHDVHVWQTDFSGRFVGMAVEVQSGGPLAIEAVFCGYTDMTGWLHPMDARVLQRMEAFEFRRPVTAQVAHAIAMRVAAKEPTVLHLLLLFEHIERPAPVCTCGAGPDQPMHALGCNLHRVARRQLTGLLYEDDEG